MATEYGDAFPSGSLFLGCCHLLLNSLWVNHSDTKHLVSAPSHFEHLIPRLPTLTPQLSASTSGSLPHTALAISFRPMAIQKCAGIVELESFWDGISHSSWRRVWKTDFDLSLNRCIQVQSRPSSAIEDLCVTSSLSFLGLEVSAQQIGVPEFHVFFAIVLVF